MSNNTSRVYLFVWGRHGIKVYPTIFTCLSAITNMATHSYRAHITALLIDKVPTFQAFSRLWSVFSELTFNASELSNSACCVKAVTFGSSFLIKVSWFLLPWAVYGGEMKRLNPFSWARKWNQMMQQHTKHTKEWLVDLFPLAKFLRKW